VKTHVRKVGNEASKDVPLCVFSNGRRARYHHLGASVVVAKDFRTASDRCQLCEQAYLVERNRQRKAKGLPPVQHPFEGLD
jgi:hypothetical protein